MNSAMQPLSSSSAAGVIKDTTGSQVIQKTLDKVNTPASQAAPAANAESQMRNDALNTAGIGTRLNATV